MKRADLKNRVYMQIAKMLSELSTCNRLKVGAVLLGFDGSVVGTGYNGSLPGLAHCDEASCNTNQRCLRTRHAERSALDYSQAKVATAYVTHEPCLRCTQDLIARGCKVIYFEVAYFGSPEEAEARARLVQESGVSFVAKRHHMLTTAQFINTVSETRENAATPGLPQKHERSKGA